MSACANLPGSRLLVPGLVAVVVLLLSACSSSTIDASNLDKKVESAQAFISEARFVAEKSREGKLTGAYRSAHVDALRDEVDGIRNQLESAPKQPQVAGKAAQAAALLGEASKLMADLADHGTDEAGQSRLEELANSLKELRSGD